MYFAMQADAHFREELESVNIDITVENRMFKTEDDPIETADLFMSVTIVDYLLRVLLFSKLEFLSRLKVKTIVCL